MIKNLADFLEAKGYTKHIGDIEEVPNTSVSNKFYRFDTISYENEMDFTSNFKLGILTLEVDLIFINENEDAYFERLKDIKTLVTELNPVEGFYGFEGFTYGRLNNDLNKSVATLIIKWRFESDED